MEITEQKYIQTFQEGEWVAEDPEQSRQNRRLKYVKYLENTGREVLTKETNIIKIVALASFVIVAFLPDSISLVMQLKKLNIYIS